MPKRKSVPAAPPATPEEVQAAPLADDSFVVSLREELARSQKSAGEKGGEDLAHRGDLNKRLLQDLWEVHNQFEQINVHLTVEPSQTLFATFVEYPRSGRSATASTSGRSRRSSSTTAPPDGSGSLSASGTTEPPRELPTCAGSTSGAREKPTTSTPGGCG